MSLTPSNRVIIYEHVTGGGFAGQDLPESWATEGLAMRRTLCEEFASIPGLQVVALHDDRFPDVPSPWTTIRVGPGEAESLLSNLSRSARHTLVVAPETHGLLARCASVVDHGWLGCSPQAIDLCANKARLADHLRDQGFRVPDHWIVPPHSPWPTEAPDQAVLKPIDGAGSLDTRLVNCSERLPDFSEPRLLQTFHPGTSMSASFLVDPEGHPFLMGVGLQRQVLQSSAFAYLGGTIPFGDPAWADEATRAVRTVPGLRGWVGVDFIREESGQSIILEINPRVTTSLVGLRSRLPLGTLGRAWMSTELGNRTSEVSSIASMVHAQPSIRFHPDGRIFPEMPGS